MRVEEEVLWAGAASTPARVPTSAAQASVRQLHRGPAGPLTIVARLSRSEEPVSSAGLAPIFSASAVLQGPQPGGQVRKANIRGALTLQAGILVLRLNMVRRRQVAGHFQPVAVRA
jgi:hypothetical protein